VCQGTSRSTLKSSVASGVFQQAGFAKLLRLVFDTAALRGSARIRASFVCVVRKELPVVDGECLYAFVALLWLVPDRRIERVPAQREEKYAVLVKSDLLSRIRTTWSSSSPGFCVHHLQSPPRNA
jgi:hypothetical protein